jgi:hypothetical protein
MAREHKRRMGRVTISRMGPSVISREMEQDYIPEEAYEEDEEFVTALEETRDEFSIRDITVGNGEEEPWLSQAVADDILLEANAEGVLHDIEQFTADTEIREEFEERQQIHVGSKSLYRQLKQHNYESPELTAGDIDAAWQESDVGDETPGGLHPAPTPDQDVVDDIGKAVGVTYADDEPLHTVEKIRNRDVHRWELDPASADDSIDAELNELDEQEENERDPRPRRI